MKEQQSPVHYRFADAESMRAAKAAFACVKAGQKGAFIVTGDGPGCGKTTFVRECLEQRYPFPAPICPAGEAALQRQLFNQIHDGYVWFDDVTDKLLRSSTLLAFVRATSWSSRALRSTIIETLANRCVVFVTGNSLTITPDLVRRFRVIDLAQWDGGAK